MRSAAVSLVETYGPYLGFDARGRLHIDGCDVLELADRFGTPLWVISERTIRHNYQTLLEAFRTVYANTRIVYASKANPELAILRILQLEGALVDAVTMGHIRLELRAGFDPEDIVFNGNNKTIEELRWALANGVGEINVDSLPEMRMLAELQPRTGRPANISLRLAIDTGRFADDPEFAAYWSGSKFGMSEEEATEAASLAAAHPGLRLTGLHSHVGFSANYAEYSAERDLERHRRCARQTLAFATLLERELGVKISRLNLGGGFRVGRREGFGPWRQTQFPSAAEYAAAVAGEVAGRSGGDASREPQLLVEPGGYIVSDAVVLLGQVGLQKEAASHDGIVRWVFLDNTTAYHFVRRMSSNFYHHVVPVQRRAGAEEIVNIAGPACSVDAIATDVHLSPMERGDVLAVLDQGSYCEAITTDFCAIPIPAAILVRDGDAELVRRRQTVQEIESRYLIPARLDGEARS